MGHSSLTHSPTEGHLGCFQILAIMNKVAINMVCGVCVDLNFQLGFPGGSAIKNPPTNAGDVDMNLSSRRSPGEGNGNPLQYSCWRIPWMEEPGGLWSMGSRRVRCDCVHIHCLSVHLSMCLSINLSIHLLSICVSIIYLSIHYLYIIFT